MDFEHGNARNEAGELGQKSTVERIRELGASYAALDDLIQTPQFLALIGKITGNTLTATWTGQCGPRTATGTRIQ